MAKLLDMRIERLITERFKDLTEIQKKSFEAILNENNTLIIAPTGHGKTLAVMLPVFHNIIDTENKGIQVLYITPLKALNRDLLERIEWWCNKLGISHAVRHGDTSISERAKQTRKPPKLLIVTPETFGAILAAPRLGQALKNCKYVIIDEVHSICDNKRGAQLSLALERLKQKTNPQIIGLSATIGSPESIAKYLSPNKECQIVSLTEPKKTEIFVEKPKPAINVPKNLDLDAEAVGRLYRVKEIIEKDKTLIFVNTRQVAEALSSRLHLLKVKIGIHHGSLAKQVRLRAEKDFKANQTEALLATSSLELGIDIGDIENVIQYMSPRQVSRLIQRIGRSGHGINRISRGHIIVSDMYDTLESLAVSLLLKQGIQEKNNIESKAIDVIAHQLVGLLLENEQIELMKAHKILEKAAAYNISYGELEEVAEQLSKQRILYLDKSDNTLKKSLNTRTYYYTRLSTIPITVRRLVKDIELNKVVSTLDEAFASSLEIGETFITKGLPWRIVELTEEEVLVEAGDDFSLSLPDWEGEQIPVPFIVSQKVGELMDLYYNKKILEINKYINFVGTLDLPDEKWYPKKDELIIECFADLIVIHSLFGTKTNETIGRCLSYLLTIKQGTSNQLIVDPYSIIINTSKVVKSQEIKDLIENLEDIRALIENSLADSKLFLFKFNHIAYNFGLVNQKQGVSKRAVKYLTQTPIYKETMRVLLSDYFDVPNAIKIIELVKANKIIIKCKNPKELSEWSRQVLTKVHAGELMAPIEPHSEIMKAFAKHLLEKRIKLICSNCNRPFYIKIDDADEKIKCLNCKGSVIGYAGFFKDGKLVEKNKKFIDESAPLIQAYGKRALIALSVYGIGPETARRILQKIHKEEDHFFYDLLEAQKNFIKNKKYWRM
ncbi:DEAD/DEAH box helicase [Candidatus Micrarchaeota archaeon]|nr:DEAD/DEAH box helicase [Candidatus Micrarchaeota archaeon]